MRSRVLRAARRRASPACYSAATSHAPARCRLASSSSPFSSSSSASISASTPLSSCGPPPASVLPLLSGHGASVTFPVEWGAMDAFGHVNNVAYVRYIESGRVAALLDMASAAQRVEGVSEAKLQRAVSSFMSGRGVGVILKSVAVKYRQPVTYPDRLTVASALSDLQADRFTLSHLVVSHRQQAVVAEGQGTLVCYDYTKREKAALPELLHTAIAQWGKRFAGRTEDDEKTGRRNADGH